MATRIRQLDVLRGVAILLVLGRHMEMSRGWLTPPLRVLCDGWQLVGWVGVDLFFVLSGFLVSGLLFGEYTRHGTLSIGRFLIRRGLKIYPSFYLFIAITVCIKLLMGEQIPIRSLIAELLYFQNYTPGLWWHTWSLAVEEHFYLLLPICLLVLLRRYRHTKDPFAMVLPIVIALVVCLTTFRLITALNLPLPFHSELYPTLFPTHLRMDGLAWGVMLSYFYHFRRSVLENFVRTWWYVLLPVSVVLISPCAFLVLEDSFFMKTFGLTGLYMGFGGILLATLFPPTGVVLLTANWLGRLSAPIALIGVYSYSIYLWHLSTFHWGVAWLKSAFPETVDFSVRFLFYLGCSLVVGIAFSKLVEMPVLAFRDRIFPSRNRSLQAPAQIDPVVDAPLVPAV